MHCSLAGSSLLIQLLPLAIPCRSSAVAYVLSTAAARCPARLSGLPKIPRISKQSAAMSSSASSSNGKRPRGPPSVPRPSSSILLLSPRNQILLLARVKTSSSFPSAHVFPGGNVDIGQDGPLPPEESFERHEDSATYRLAAIRECFEESGLLLAKRPPDGRLLSVPEAERELARRDVHSQTTKFVDWVRAQGGEPDLTGLMPFTRFVTPTTVPKRFTTQMYVYFLPLDAGEQGRLKGEGQEVVIPTPTSDGGVEHTAAKFLWPQQWLDLAKKNELIMYPPQVYLCSLLAPFFPPGEWSIEELQSQRDKCTAFMRTSTPPWAEKVMSPDLILMLDGGVGAMGLKKPGPELAKSGRSGDAERVILARHTKEGPRDVQVRWRDEVMKEWRQQQDEKERQEKEKGKGKL